MMGDPGQEAGGRGILETGEENSVVEVYAPPPPRPYQEQGEGRGEGIGPGPKKGGGHTIHNPHTHTTSQKPPRLILSHDES